jgi:hypothetical protein
VAQRVQMPLVALRTNEATGLSLPALAAIFSFSLIVFMFWDGSLWNAETGASHAGRIFVSYAIVVPLVGAALLFTRRWDHTRLITATIAIWAIKLIVTSTLYFALAPGATHEYQPAAAWERSLPQLTAEKAPRYRAAIDDVSLVTVGGTVLRAGAPVSGALVFIDQPLPGLPIERDRLIEIAVMDARYDRPLYVAATADRLEVSNRDGELHTFSVRKHGVTRAHVPLPAHGRPQRISFTGGPGHYELGCENHASERAALAVFDHPYFAVTNSNGRFSIEGVAPGKTTLIVKRSDGSEQNTTVAAGFDVVIDISEDQG